MVCRNSSMDVTISTGLKCFRCRAWDGHVQSRCVLISEIAVLL